MSNLCADNHSVSLSVVRINETRNQSAGSNRIQVYLIIEKASMFAQVKQAKGKQKKNVQDSIESLIWTCTSE